MSSCKEKKCGKCDKCSPCSKKPTSGLWDKLKQLVTKTPKEQDNAKK